MPPTAEDLVLVVDEFAREVNPRRKAALTLESSLERDAGVDSLGRVELLVRLERKFDVRLPDQGVMAAETVGDLLVALGRAHPGHAALDAPAPAAPLVDDDVGAPAAAKTVVEVLQWHVDRHAGRPHLLLLDDDDRVETLTYGDLQREALAAAAGMRRLDLAPGQPVALMLPTCRGYFASFFGALLAGAIPVPLYPPHRRSAIEEHLRRQVAIFRSSQTPILVTTPEIARMGPLLKALAPGLRAVTTPEELMAGGAEGGPLRGRPGDIAMLQYTSGSTGDPKGVILTNAQLLANFRVMADGVSAGRADVVVSWLPLYHDMGLIGAWLTALYAGVPSVIMSPLAFLARPSRWLRAIHAHRGTLAAAPNFAYDLCATRIPDEELRGLDLGSWRLALNGAEAVRPETIDRFAARFAPYGFRREAMLPVYGLAECALGLCVPPAGRPPRVDRIRRDAFDTQGRAVPADPADPSPLSLVGCGRPLPGYEIRILGDDGHEREERLRGRIQFRGPSATSGYYRNPEATRRLFDGDWVETGDFGYLADGEIFIAGRVKDIIIKAGRNMHPEELEQAVGLIPGVRRGCVAAFGSPDPESGTERLVVVAETREADAAKREETTRRIRDAALSTLGVPADDVLLVPPHAVPKTPSGKLRRDHCRKLYETGAIARPPRAVAVQMMRLALGSAGNTAGRFLRVLGRLLYAAWAWSLFLAGGLVLTLALLLLPVLSWRRRAARGVCASLLRLLGLRVAVAGREHLAGGPRVLAVNHASYLDAVVLQSILPSSFSFVAKAEFRGKPLARLFMGRLGVEFVERADAEQGVKDLAAAAELLRRGGSLVVFPEGTFTRAPGLRPFRMGAFTAAAQAGVPLVPASLRGTRAVLRDGSWRPVRGGMSFTVHAPLDPAGSDWSAAVRLRDEARARILAACGEPELLP